MIEAFKKIWGFAGEERANINRSAVYDFIQKKRSEGKCGKEAMIAGLNKFLRVYYGKVMEIYSKT